MITRTFISKTNTISNSSKENFGLNPVCSLNYGKRISRVLLWFDTDKLKDMVSDGTFKNRELLSHRLKMTNCGSVDVKKFFERDEAEEYLSEKHRASSFSVIAFKIPKVWDAGRGFDNSTDTWFLGYSSVSKDGSTWEKSMNGVKWHEQKDASGETINTPGIYTIDFLLKEYQKYINGEESIVVAEQHFDYGNENLDLDITDFVNEIIFDKTNKKRNYGLCLAFSPEIEDVETESENYINFFTNNTNTFFQPYVETRYNIVVNDDRYKCYAGKKNRLYLFASVGGNFVELDELPTCEINGEISPVSSDTKGIYYTEAIMPRKGPENAILEDIWSGVKLDGEEIEDIEQEFVVLPSKAFFNFGDEIDDNKSLNPVISGINDDQKLYQGDKREIAVVFRVPYTTSNYELVDEAYYRIYVKDGNREIDVIDWDNIFTIGKKNVFWLDTASLVPQSYYVDIKAKIGRETLIFKNKFHFTIVDNVTEIKR